MKTEATDNEKPRQFTLRPDAEPVLSWSVGEVTITRVVEGISEFPRGFLPALTDERIDACGDWALPFVREDGRRLLLSAHSFVVQTPQTTIVVDTCVGDHTPRPMQGDTRFIHRLDATIEGGLAAVDVVVCTHLHFDHVGWNTQRIDGRWVPTFPNARYLVSTEELAATVADDHMDVIGSSVQPLIDAEVLDAVASDAEIDSSVRLRPSPGHSPGHVCVAIETEAGTALITGDATHSPMQFAFTDVSAEFADSDSDQATMTRDGLVADLLDSDTLILGTHFPTPTAGLLRRDESGLVRFEGVT